MFFSSPDRTQRVTAAVARARKALVEAAALVAQGALGELPDTAVQELTETVLRVADAATAVGSAGIERVDRTGAVRGQGYVSTAGRRSTTSRCSAAAITTRSTTRGGSCAHAPITNPSNPAAGRSSHARGPAPKLPDHRVGASTPGRSPMPRR
jgi:hypothetical protein